MLHIYIIYVFCFCGCREYYFSEENLLRDFFLRRKMDNEGYLPINLIATFHRVQALSTDYEVVIDAIKDSEVLELNDFKVRLSVYGTSKHNVCFWTWKC